MPKIKIMTHSGAKKALLPHQDRQGQARHDQEAVHLLNGHGKPTKLKRALRAPPTPTRPMRPPSSA